MNSPVSRLNDLPILTTSEIEEQAIAILEELQNSPIPPVDKSQLIQKLQDFKEQWHYAFTDFGTDYQGELAYRDLITDFDQTIAPLANKWLPPSGTGNRAVNVIISMLSTPKSVAVPLTKRLSIARSKLKAKLEEDKNQNFPIPEFAKPIFIVSAPRAGSTLLFETLAQFPDLWTIGDESHKIIEGIPALHPAARNFSSNRLIESDATPEIALNLRKRFVTQLQNREGVKYLHLPESQRSNKIRFLEKTPKNALRIPFIKAIFPDALFIYLYREPKGNISSLMEGWRSQRFISYQSLPGWPYRNWSFLLVPEWLSLQKSSLVEIAAYQWKKANYYLIQDLKTLPSSCWHLVNYQDLIEQPQQTINSIAEFTQLHQDQQIVEMLFRPLAIAQRTLSSPSAEKWRKNARELATVLPDLEDLINILENRKTQI